MKEFEIFKREEETSRPGVYVWETTHLYVPAHCEEEVVGFASVFYDTHPENIKAEEV